MGDREESPGTSNDDNDVRNGETNFTKEMFKEICGVDDEIAENLLRESGGDLEAAIHQFFFTNENPEVLQNQDNEIQEIRRRQNVAVGQPDQQAQQNQRLPVSRQAHQLTWIQWFRGLVLLPFRFFYSTATDILVFVYNLFFGPSNRPPIVARSRRAIQQQNFIEDRLLMRQQQNEYERALAIDREKLQERKRLEVQRREEERRANAEAERLKARAELLAQKREEIAELLRTEDIEPEKEECPVRIRISFPNGQKIERRFRQQDSLERLFQFVFVHPDCPDNFSLLTSYPSTLLDCAPAWYKSEFGDENDGQEGGGETTKKTFAEMGLLNSAVVMVRDNDA